MAQKEIAVGYHTEDGHNYCVECIRNESEIAKMVNQAITARDLIENLYFCDLCETRIE